MGHAKKHIVKTLGIGFVILLPIALTFGLFYFVFQKIDKWLHYVQDLPYVPDVAGVGVAAVLVIAYLTGLFARNVLGKKVVHIAQQLMLRSPIFKLLYSPAKQMAESFNIDDQGWWKVVTIEYPRKGVWALGFETGKIRKDGTLCSIVLVPTPPTCQPGPAVLVPVEEVQEADWSVVDLLTFTACMCRGGREAINSIKKSP